MDQVRLSVDIPACSKGKGTLLFHCRPYTVRSDGSMTYATVTQRTFEEFRKLHATLAQTHAAVAAIAFPKKPLISTNSAADQLRHQLCSYLQQALRNKSAEQDPVLRQFLGLRTEPPAPIPAPAPHATSSRVPANALHIACAKNDIDLAEKLIVQAKCDVDLLVDVGKLKAAPVHKAALSEKGAEMIGLLIRYGANVNAVTSPCGRTPLHLAAQRGRADVVRVLVAAGARLEVLNSNNERAMDNWSGDRDTKLMLMPLAALHTQLEQARLLQFHGRVQEAKDLFVHVLEQMNKRNKLCPHDQEPISSILSLLEEAERLKRTIAESKPPLLEPEPEPEPEPQPDPQLSVYLAEISRLRAEAQQLAHSGNKVEALKALKRSKHVQVKWAALEYNLEEGWLHDPTQVELLTHSRTALRAEKERLASAKSGGAEFSAAMQERLGAVLDKLAQLDSQIAAGGLSTNAWLRELKRSIERDRLLEKALRDMQRNNHADEVAARLNLVVKEANTIDQEQSAQDATMTQSTSGQQQDALAAAMIAVATAAEERAMDNELEQWTTKTETLQAGLTKARGLLARKKLLEAAEIFRLLEEKAREMACPVGLSRDAHVAWDQLQKLIIKEAGAAAAQQVRALQAAAVAQHQLHQSQETQQAQHSQALVEKQQAVEAERAALAAEREAVAEQQRLAATKAQEDAAAQAAQMKRYKDAMQRREAEREAAMREREIQREQQLHLALQQQHEAKSASEAAKANANEQLRELEAAKARAQAEQDALVSKQQELDREFSDRQRSLEDEQQLLQEEQRTYQRMQEEARAEQQRWAESTAAGQEEIEQARRHQEARLRDRQAALDAMTAQNEAERAAQQAETQRMREDLARQQREEEQRVRESIDAFNRHDAELHATKQRVQELMESHQEMKQQQEAIDKWGRADMRGFVAKGSCRDWITEQMRMQGAAERLGLRGAGATGLHKLVGEIDARLSAVLAREPHMDESERNRRFSLLLYTADNLSFYKAFNAALRSKDAGRFIHWRPFYYHLMSALRDLPDVENTVFRGIADPPHLERYVQTKQVCWQGFSSTTTLPGKAKEFAGPAGYIFELKVHNAKDIREYSWYGATEGELLLNPNMNFVVTKELHVPSEGPLRGCNVVEMFQVNDDKLWS